MLPKLITSMIQSLDSISSSKKNEYKISHELFTSYHEYGICKEVMTISKNLKNDKDIKYPCDQMRPNGKKSKRVRHCSSKSSYLMNY